MAEDKQFDEIFSSNGPEVAMWNHLYSGIDLARMELDRLSPEGRKFLTRFAENLFLQRTDLTVPPDDGFADLAQQALEVPWLKFAADLVFAEEAVGRAEQALKRYIVLQPILTRYKLSALASKCLKEAGRTFLFSFDAACIAFCSAALEQTLRDEVVAAGIISEPDLKRQRCTAFTLLEMAKKAKLLSEASEQPAADLIAKRNQVMHRRFEGLKEEALKAMEQIGLVLQDLGRTRASDA
jgi:hypothetical protein